MTRGLTTHRRGGIGGADLRVEQQHRAVVSRRRRARWRSERGTALIIALLATLLLTALGTALILLTNTETAISANYRDAQEALYAADAGVERVVQDLLMVPRWNDVLSGSLQSGFVDTTLTPTLADGSTLNLTTETANLQADTDSADLWGANDPVWRLYAWGPIRDLLPTGTINSPMYVAVWVGDDPSETDGNPSSDANGVLTLRAVAFGPGNTRKVVEVTVARTSSTEIERGYIAQRGQEELNQRARKAAVQVPGKALTSMRLGVQTGGIAVVP
jgi:Tfp pilus assembly protein PilX